MTLTPAYGRDYKSKKAVIEDLEGGKDFMISSFGMRARPISIRDFVKGDEITIRYAKLRKSMIYKVKS